MALIPHSKAFLFTLKDESGYKFQISTEESFRTHDYTRNGDFVSAGWTGMVTLEVRPERAMRSPDGVLAALLTDARQFVRMLEEALATNKEPHGPTHIGRESTQDS